ncbi:TTK protein kinase, variant 2 [Aphanomyces astaci]|uniref:TTK protein kinase, variant 2 n=1 Tax=Aphanomyces astaci TaxID=112090 RepID=W4H8W2_APHAT|nr:TTK protein kinase, variant 2 [Aphanomyces astaci]ETV88367.1 TTK protein kinase, variant 2 [Aphanomyces astaci]|eukprot:XP_009820767.1 TTK protein kinase, variant 2 [Aphanomyces astaci]
MEELLRKDENLSDFFMLGIRDSDMDGDHATGAALLDERKSIVNELLKNPFDPALWKRLVGNCKRLAGRYPHLVQTIFRRALSCLKQPGLDGHQRSDHIDIILDYGDLLKDPKRKRGLLRQALMEGLPQNQTKFFEYYAKFEKSQHETDTAHDMLNLAVAKSLLSSADRDRIWKGLNDAPPAPMAVVTSPTPQPTLRRDFVSGIQTPRQPQDVGVPRSISKLREGLMTPLSSRQHPSSTRSSQKFPRITFDRANLGLPQRVLKSEHMSQDSDKENDEPESTRPPTVESSKNVLPERPTSGATLWQPSKIPQRASTDFKTFAAPDALKQRYGGPTAIARSSDLPPSISTPSRGTAPLATPKSAMATGNHTAVKHVVKRPLSPSKPYQVSEDLMDSPTKSDMEITLAHEYEALENPSKRRRNEPNERIASSPVTSKANTPSPPPLFSASPSDSRPLHVTVVDRLIDPKNHFTVNGITFLSLKQIGSGGTSKVFRVLGPDMQTYALKRIKMKKMDEASVTSYQNEISLLKSLQGSPHVIKLVANELDYNLKVLYVVRQERDRCGVCRRCVAYVCVGDGDWRNRPHEQTQGAQATQHRRGRKLPPDSVASNAAGSQLHSQQAHYSWGFKAGQLFVRQWRHQADRLWNCQGHLERHDQRHLGAGRRHRQLHATRSGRELAWPQRNPAKGGASGRHLVPWVHLVPDRIRGHSVRKRDAHDSKVYHDRRPQPLDQLSSPQEQAAGPRRAVVPPVGPQAATSHRGPPWTTGAPIPVPRPRGRPHRALCVRVPAQGNVFRASRHQV